MTTEVQPGFHVMAKPTGAICNLDCAYCFFLSKESLYPYNTYEPYVLHTTDEGPKSQTNPDTGKPVPNHAIAFRTLDFSRGAPYGGGKLGMYSFWNYTQGGAVPPTQPDTSVGPPQFEFYNYSPSNPNSNPEGLATNYGETGNQVETVDPNSNLSGWPGRYQQEFNAIVQTELYSLSMPNGGLVPNYITLGQMYALQAYLGYVNSQAGQNDTTWQT